MIKFFIMADADLPILAYNMTKFMNGIQRNGGLIISSNVIRDVNPLLTGIVFYSETKRERINIVNEELMDGKQMQTLTKKIMESATQ